jgi:hypothetical protein
MATHVLGAECRCCLTVGSMCVSMCAQVMKLRHRHDQLTDEVATLTRQLEELRLQLADERAQWDKQRQVWHGWWVGRGPC